tara:strand:- start:82740 stop:82958 length:219 start_codon:yes stop_codon:yes gene_type:complete
MNEVLQIDFINLFFGVILLIGGSLRLIKVVKDFVNDNNYSSTYYSYDINIIFGCFIFIIVGIVMVYRELSVI